MDQAAVPFWEETYQKDDVLTFSAEPNSAVKEFEHLLDKQSYILEAGCGEGQNVLYLARQGYRSIDAFDLSKAGISKLNRLCAVNHVEINAFVQDLAAYEFHRNYDLIMSFATLCFVERPDWKRFLYEAKEHTNLGGIHIMHTFIDAVPASADIAPFAVGLAQDGELKNCIRIGKFYSSNPMCLKMSTRMCQSICTRPIKSWPARRRKLFCLFKSKRTEFFWPAWYNLQHPCPQ